MNLKLLKILWLPLLMTGVYRPYSLPLLLVLLLKALQASVLPVAITAAMLTGLGFNPIYAAGICLIANTAPVAFGAIGIPVVVAAQVANLDLMHVSQVVGRQLPFLSILVPLWLCVTMAGWKRAMEVLPALVVAGVCFAGTQFFTSNYVNAYLPDITSAVVTIIGLLIFLKIWKPATIWKFPDEKQSTEGKVELQYSVGEVLRAWAPYLILALLVFLWADDKFIGLKKVLVDIDKQMPWFALQWPGLHNMVIKAAPVVAKNSPYGAIYTVNLLSAAGTAIFFSGLLSLLIIPNYGLGRAMTCLARTTKQLVFPICTIAMILGLAYIMNFSGMSSTMGLAFTKTGTLFPFFSPILGWLGVFLTGSDTSANALFGSMQRTAAEQIGVDPYLTVAANLLRRCLRQNDFPAKYFRCDGCHRHGRPRRRHLPLYCRTQYCYVDLHVRLNVLASV